MYAICTSLKPSLLMLVMRHVRKAAANYISKIENKNTISETLYLLETKQFARVETVLELC